MAKFKGIRFDPWKEGISIGVSVGSTVTIYQMDLEQAKLAREQLDRAIAEISKAVK
jgi:hypothetical protein